MVKKLNIRSQDEVDQTALLSLSPVSGSFIWKGFTFPKLTVWSMYSSGTISLATFYLIGAEVITAWSPVSSLKNKVAYHMIMNILYACHNSGNIMWSYELTQLIWAIHLIQFCKIFFFLNLVDYILQLKIQWGLLASNLAQIKYSLNLNQCKWN